MKGDIANLTDEGTRLDVLDVLIGDQRSFSRHNYLHHFYSHIIISYINPKRLHVSNEDRWPTFECNYSCQIVEVDPGCNQTQSPKQDFYPCKLEDWTLCKYGLS